MSAAGRPVMIASWNGAPATVRAVELMSGGMDQLEAMVRGVAVVEDDPEEMSVGYGGLPNEDGQVELDAAVMDGRAGRAGAVAGLRGIRHASAVALEVMRRTDHVLLVGEGARKFARVVGFKEEDLLTEKARAAWLKWKGNLSVRDAWLGEEEATSEFGRAQGWGSPGGPAEAKSRPAPGQSGGSPGVPFTFGTIHVSGLGADGRICAVTSTSGLSYKIAGRAGDSPVVGAGLFADDAVGSAGATGRGEAVLQACGAFSVVREMERGTAPTEACLAVLRQIAGKTRAKRLLDAKGRPSFNVTLYALRKDGAWGAASMHEGYECIVQEADAVRKESCAYLYAKER